MVCRTHLACYDGSATPFCTQVALLSKHAIIIADKKLANSCTVHETIRVKV